MQNQKGFTIIELIIVIAVITILASIVLINVTAYLSQSKDAAIKGNMASIISNAAAYFESNSGSYTDTAGTDTGFCGDGKFTVPLSAMTAAGSTVVQYCTPATFCACSTLKSSTNTFCADSTGYKNETATACATRCSDIQTTCID